MANIIHFPSCGKMFVPAKASAELQACLNTMHEHDHVVTRIEIEWLTDDRYDAHFTVKGKDK